MIDLAFELGSERVVATCDVDNTASQNVMINCGMHALVDENPHRLCYGLDAETRVRSS